MQEKDKLNPPELLDDLYTTHIFKYLNSLNLAQIASVNKKWYEFSKNAFPLEIVKEDIPQTIIKLFYAYLFEAISSNNSNLELATDLFKFMLSKDPNAHMLDILPEDLNKETASCIKIIQGNFEKLKSNIERTQIDKNVTAEHSFKSLLKPAVDISPFMKQSSGLFFFELLLNINIPTQYNKLTFNLNNTELKKLITRLENHLTFLLQRIASYKESLQKQNIKTDALNEYGPIMLPFLRATMEAHKILPQIMLSQANAPSMLNATYIILDRLLEKKILDPTKICGELGTTPLIAFTSLGSASLAIYLAQRVPEAINIKDKSERTALHIAMSRMQFKLVEILLENNADPTIQDKDGNTCLHKFFKEKWIIQKHTAPFLQNLLDNYLETKTDINLKNNAGDTILHYAVEYGTRESVELLLRNGADPGIFNKAGLTAIDIANNLQKPILAQWLTEQLDKINEERMENQMPSFMRSLGANYFE